MAPGWSRDFTVVAATLAADAALSLVSTVRTRWVLVEREGGALRYVFSREELLARPHLLTLLAAGADLHAMPLAEALDLHEGQASFQAVPSDAPPAWPIDPAIPSQARAAAVVDGRVVAVGGADVDATLQPAAKAPRRGQQPQQRQGAEPAAATGAASPQASPPAPPFEPDMRLTRPVRAPEPATFRRRGTRGAAPAAAVPTAAAEPPVPAADFDVSTSRPFTVRRPRGFRSAPPHADVTMPPRSAEPPRAALTGSPSAGSDPSAAEPTAGATAPPADDEGTAPIRFPSIAADGPLAPGVTATFVVDLAREEAPTTVGGVALPAQPADWATIVLEVLLVSPQVDFGSGDAAGRGQITVRRNADSLTARVTGQVRAEVARGSEIELKARFLLGTRYCGSAARRFAIDGAPAGPAPAITAPPVQVDTDAPPPDLTVFITLFDQSAPGRLHWRLVTAPFPGRPPRLDGIVDLGRDPAAEASALFRQFAKLERGQHRESIEGFGEQLWQRAPQAFRDAYWALHDHLQRPMTIQFVSDDPHLPWELAAPYRDGEAHGPLALRHAVARWIGQWQGYMRNRLPAGQLVAIAPRYTSASTRLSLAEAAAQALVDGHGARRWGGTRNELLALLEEPPTDGTVALLYFTGHGAFATDAADASLIKLEDGAQLSSREVARQKVRLGERDGTVVFLNACEVGASGSVLGNVGGWADAVLSRRFGAFIAPLWAIDEEDAKQVTEELMARIVTRHEPLGAALRDLRAAYGGISPTFYSYLLYGDVTARLG
jgi:hypothetical protein